MNQKISSNKKHKYSNEEKLALVKDENTSALINIAQEDDSNICELLQNFLLVTFIFILLLLHTQMFLMLQISWLEKEIKSNLKATPPLWLLKLSVFSNPPDYYFLIFFPTTPTISHPASIRDLRISLLGGQHDNISYAFQFNEQSAILESKPYQTPYCPGGPSLLKYWYITILISTDKAMTA